MGGATVFRQGKKHDYMQCFPQCATVGDGAGHYDKWGRRREQWGGGGGGGGGGRELWKSRRESNQDVRRRRTGWHPPDRMLGHCTLKARGFSVSVCAAVRVVEEQSPSLTWLLIHARYQAHPCFLSIAGGTCATTTLYWLWILGCIDTVMGRGTWPGAGLPMTDDGRARTRTDDTLAGSC